MPKFITGIVAVLCLHLGYVAYLATERQELAVNKVGVEGFPVPDNTSDLVEAALPAEGEYIPTPVRPVYIQRQQKSGAVEPSATYARVSRKTVVQSEYASAVESYAVRRPLKVIITDPYADRPSDEHRAVRVEPVRKTELPVRKESKSEGKSIIAKAAPIVKKPYDWIKSFASKLR